MNEEKKYSIRDKKRFLNQFFWISKEMENIEEKLKKLTIKIQGIRTSDFSAMPKGGQPQDIVDLLAQKEKYQNQLAKKMAKNGKYKVTDRIFNRYPRRFKIKTNFAI